MSNVKVQFLTTCMHNRIVHIAGEVIELDLNSAEDLLKLNLVKFINSDVLEKNKKLTNHNKLRQARRKSNENNYLK